eukprot:TRINITY_DN8328_c0_g2_i1.p1 TRINITY_DN8328_c0_g2~~TRINITY_DN8328_c0_g2_i1.p1  ORF type:complete len:234 (-),score=49.83 TRINITY_DN8328_c0_g2_i1:119-820(-)
MLQDPADSGDLKHQFSSHDSALDAHLPGYSAVAYQPIDHFETRVQQKKPNANSIPVAEVEKRKFRVLVILTSLGFILIVLIMAFFIPRNIETSIQEFKVLQNNFISKTFSGSAIVRLENSNFVTARIQTSVISIIFNGTVIAQAYGEPYTLPEQDSVDLSIPPLAVPIKIINSAFSKYALSACSTTTTTNTFTLDLSVEIPVEYLFYSRTYVVASSVAIPCVRVTEDQDFVPT